LRTTELFAQSYELLIEKERSVSRPRKCRKVEALPPASFYKPQGISLRGLPVEILSVDRFEALRLADAEALDHQDAADRMGISRPTFTRLVGEARSVVARALVNGWALGIEGGSFEIAGDTTAAPDHGRGGQRCCRRHGDVSLDEDSDDPAS
jgi:predicted DNA-binding protein (UPF0251 family)